MAAGNIVGMIAVRRFVLAGGRDASAEQLPCDGGGVDALGGKLEDELHNGSSLRVRLHSAIGAFAVAVGTDFALILAALHLGVLGALGFNGHIAAVIFADEILERHVHAAGVTLEFAAVKIVADGNEAGMEQWEHTLDEIAGFNAVSSEAGKILDDDAVDLIGRTSSMSFCTCGRSKFVPLYPLSMNSIISALRASGMEAAYSWRTRLWFSMLRLSYL